MDEDVFGAIGSAYALRETPSNWALKEESVGHKHQQHQQDEDALYPNDTFVAYYEGEQQQVDGGIDEDLLAALSDGNSWGASDSKHGHSASNTKSASLMPTTDALDALLKEQQHRPPSTAAPVAAIGVSSAHAEKRFPSESNASKAPLSSGSASSSSYPRPSTIPPGPTSRTSYQRPSTMLSSGTSRTDGAAKTAVKPFAAAAASSTSSHGIHTTKPSPTEPNVTHSIRISYTRPSPTLPHNISSQKAPSPGISNRTYHSKPSPTLSGAPSPGLTSRSPQSHPSPKLGGPVTSTISPVIPPAKPSPSSPILSSQVPAPKNSNSTLQFSTVKPSPSFSFASGPPSASAFAPVSKDDPFAFAYSDSFLGTTKNEEESAAGLQNEYPVYSEVQEDIAYNYGSYSNPTEYSAQQQQQGQYSQEHGNPMVAFSTYGDGSHVSQEQPIEADTTETQQWSGQALALPNQETNFPQGWSRANTQQWDQQEQIATDPYSSNAEEGQPQDNGYSNEYGFGQESARVDSYYAEEHPTGYTEEPVFTQGSIQTTAYQTASPEYDQRSGLTSSYENQPRSGPVSSIIATPGYANTQSPFLPPSSRQAPARPSSGPSFADFSASSSASRDPLSMKQKGHAVATFGPAGSLVLVRPKRQDWFERDPLTGRSKPVQKVTPGQVLLGCTKDYLSPAVAQLYPPEWVGPFIDGKKTKTKKTAVQTCVQDRVTISQSQGSASQTLLWKLLKLMVDHDGVLLGSKNEILILPRLIELIKSDSSDSKSGSTSTLESLQTLLLEGKRSEACDLALSQSRYAHALIIASHVDKATYGRAITGFTNQEFLGPVTMAFSRSNNSTDSQHEYLPLHVLYGLFGGKGHQAVLDISKPKMTAWNKILQIILANRTPNDLTAISSLGDELVAEGHTDLGHFCYLVCFTHAGVLEEPDLSRLMLIGTNHISNPSSFFRSTSSIQMTEVFEYAKGLNGTGLGFLPYFQLYKFMHALELADLGMTSRAARYYDAVEGAVKDAFSSGNVFASPLLLEMVQEFSDRISPQVKVSGKAESAGGWLSKLGNSLSGAAIGKGLDNFMAAAVGETITSPLVAESTEKRQKYDAPLVDIPSLPEAGLGLHDNICHSTADSVSYSEQSYGFQNTSLFATDGMSSQARYSQADSNFSYPSQVHPSFTEDTPQQNQSQGFYEDYNAGYAIDAFHQQYVNDSAHQQYPQYEDQQDYYQGYNQNGQDSQYGHPLNYGETQGPVSEQQGNGYLESNADQMQESNINYEQDYDQGGFTSGGANKANQSGAYQSFSPQLKSQYADPQNYYQQGNAQYGEQVDQGGLTYFDEIPPEEVEDLQKPPPSAASGGNYASYADIKPIPLPVPTPVVARQSPSVPPPMNAQDSHVPAPGDNESSDPLGLGNSISNKSRLSSKSGAESDAANVDVKKSQQDGPANPGLVASLWTSLWGSSKTDKNTGAGPVRAKLGDDLDCYFDGTKWVFPNATNPTEASSGPLPPPPKAKAPPPTPQQNSGASSLQASPAPSGATSPALRNAGTPTLTSRAGSVGSTSRRGPRSRYVDVLNPSSVKEESVPAFSFALPPPPVNDLGVGEPKVFQSPVNASGSQTPTYKSSPLSESRTRPQSSQPRQEPHKRVSGATLPLPASAGPHTSASPNSAAPLMPAQGSSSSRHPLTGSQSQSTPTGLARPAPAPSARSPLGSVVPGGSVSGGGLLPSGRPPVSSGYRPSVVRSMPTSQTRSSGQSTPNASSSGRAPVDL